MQSYYGPTAAIVFRFISVTNLLLKYRIWRRWRHHFPLKRWYPHTRLNGFVTKETSVWIFTARRTSDLLFLRLAHRKIHGEFTLMSSLSSSMRPVPNSAFPEFCKIRSSLAASWEFIFIALATGRKTRVRCPKMQNICSSPQCPHKLWTPPTLLASRHCGRAAGTRGRLVSSIWCRF
jgi:hypothetical protein